MHVRWHALLWQQIVVTHREGFTFFLHHWEDACESCEKENYYSGVNIGTSDGTVWWIHSITEQVNFGLYYRCFLNLFFNTKLTLQEKQQEGQSCSKENTLTFAMVSCVFLLLKCNVYLINSMSVLNSNSLSHIECQNVLQELLWCLWKQFFSNEKTHYVTGTGSQGRLPTTFCLWVIWPQTQPCVNLSHLLTFFLRRKLSSVLERTCIKTMPQSKVKPLVTAWIVSKKNKCFFYCFSCGDENSNYLFRLSGLDYWSKVQY